MLVIDYKVIGYEYFMDECQEYEIQLLSEMLPWSTHQEMEQTRMIMYSVCAPYMKNKKKIAEFFPLVTDKLDKAEPLKGEELKDVRNMIQQAFKIKK